MLSFESDASLYVSIASLIIACGTLIITYVTLNWFKGDRRTQDDKEFRNFIYEKIKDITFYKFDIIEIHSLGKYTDLQGIEDAEKKIVLGQASIELYADTKNLPYLQEFSEVDKNSPRKDRSFMFNFFTLNYRFHDYRKQKEGTPFLNDPKLDAYYYAFSKYLEIATKYSITVLNLHKLDENNPNVSNYYEELKGIVNYCKKENLI